MNRINRHRWIAGIVFLAAAIAWLVVGMGWLNFHISIFTIVMTIILAIILLSSLVDLNIAGSVFLLAFLSMLYAAPLGITKMVPWSILGIALLVTIGLSIIFHPHYYWHHGRAWKRASGWDYGDDWGDETINSSEHSTTTINASMGDTVRYIESNDFKLATIHASMSGVKAYFDKAVITGDKATINVDGYMCGIKLFVPKDWQIVNNIDPYMSNIEIFSGDSPHDGPTVYLTGKVSLGGLQVYYI